MSVKTPSKAKAKPKRVKQLTSSEKAEAIALWRAGSVTLDDLAKKFNRDRTTFSRLFNNVGVMKGEAREEHEKKVTETVEAAALGEAALIAQRIRDTKERHYRLAELIEKLMSDLIIKAKKENRAIGTVAGDLKALQYAIQTAKAAREEKYAVLGLNEKEADDTGELPDLVLQELTAEDVKKMHQSQLAEDEDFDMSIGNFDEGMGE